MAWWKVVLLFHTFSNLFILYYLISQANIKKQQQHLTLNSFFSQERFLYMYTAGVTSFYCGTFLFLNNIS